LDTRQDPGLLIESAVFQELFKLRANHFLNFDIHFWRTQSGAEIDFILYVNADKFIPIEVKYRSMQTAKLTRSFYSFIEAYQPVLDFMITKDYYGKIQYKGCDVHFIPFSMLERTLQEVLDFVRS
jgi:predicted AAA+ superfamily ATPase